MKTIFFILFSILAFNFSFSQSDKSEIKIVFQLTTSDTTAHKALMKQLGNILLTEPSTKIEVVCHGPGLDMVHQEKSIVSEKIAAFTQKGVVFNACEFSLKERSVSKEMILKNTQFVKAGILYIVDLQQKGYHYIKAGF
jgi:intracellular sulfur oxidation DsrE/DsrF family protein